MYSIETKTGDAIVAGEARLVPVAGSLRLELSRGGLVWNRAIGLRIEADGEETMVPIHDRTRQLQLAILGLGLAASLILWLAGGRRRTTAEKETIR